MNHEYIVKYRELRLTKIYVSLTKKYIKLFLNFNLSRSLNSLYENIVGCKNLEYFELFKSLLLIFKNDVQTLNILLLFLELIFKN
jgi:hypothetical protein